MANHSTARDQERPLLAPAAGAVESNANRTTARPEHGRLKDDVLPEESVLGRNIDWKSAYIIAISRVIGSGIFAVPGVILKAAGSVGLSLTLWVVGAIVVAAGLAVSLEYGCMLPRSGGEKVYLEFTYTRPRFLASTLVATQAVLLGFTASNCVIFSQYVFFAFGYEPDGDFWRKGFAVALLTVVTAIHGVWYKAGIRIQNFLGYVKIGLVVFMVVSALYVVIFRPSSSGDSGADPTASLTFGPDGWNDGLWEGSDWSFGTIATSLFKVFYSYAGLTNLNNVLNEVKDPVRTLKSVSLSALATACFLYLLANLAYFAVVPVDEIKRSGQLIAALFFERVFGPNVGRRFLPLAVALSAAGNVMVVTFALARLNQEISRAGFLPFSRYLSSSKPFGAPMGGLLVHYVPSVLVIVLPPSREVYSFILEVEGYPGQMYALAVTVGLVYLRWKRPELRRPFRAWMPAVVFRAVLCIALLAAPFFPPSHRDPDGLWYATYAVVGVGVVVFGFLYWLVWTVVLPRLGGYRLEEKEDILDDGTTITVFTRMAKVE
ncbi:methionine permease [Xylariaceae sp. FL0594]|nr:methionine permease [Xylariaceae sp. FL0594]